MTSHLHRSHRYQQQAQTMQRQLLQSYHLWSHLIRYSIFRPASLWSTCFHPLAFLRSPQAVAGSHLFLFASARLSLQLLLMCDSYEKLINSMSFNSISRVAESTSSISTEIWTSDLIESKEDETIADCVDVNKFFSFLS